MSFIAKSPVTALKTSKTPPAPPEGTRGIFATDDGWYDIDSDGNVKKIGDGEGSSIELANNLTETESGKKALDAVMGRVLDEQTKSLYYYGDMNIIPTDVSLFAYTDNGDGTCTITKYIGSITEVVIPYGINGLKVTSIGERAFYFCTSLTSINIPDGVTSIGSWAFCDCHELTNVTIPSSVTRIWENAFYYCTGLTSVTLGNNVTIIGGGAFNYCSSLTIVCNAGSYAEQYAKETGIPVMYDVVEPVDTSEFATKTEVSSVQSTASTAYSMATQNGLEITSLKSKTLNNASAIESLQVTVSDKANKTDTYTKTEVNEMVSDLSDLNARFNYYGDMNIVPTDATVFDYTDNGDGTCTITGFTGADITDVVIPYEIDGLRVTGIGEDAFSENTDIATIVMSGTIETIERGAFSDCTNLEKVVISDGVTVIEDGAFTGCVSLKDIKIPNSVTTIERNAFSDCTNLEKVVISDGVTVIEDGAFFNCTSLVYITIPDSVTAIGNNVFGVFDVDNPDGVLPVQIVCSQGSCAETYAIGKGIAYKYSINAPADQEYDPESENAQSGKAVAEAIGNVVEPFFVDVTAEYNDETQSFEITETSHTFEEVFNAHLNPKKSLTLRLKTNGNMYSYSSSYSTDDKNVITFNFTENLAVGGCGILNVCVVYARNADEETVVSAYLNELVSQEQLNAATENMVETLTVTANIVLGVNINYLKVDNLSSSIVDVLDAVKVGKTVVIKTTVGGNSEKTCFLTLSQYYDDGYDESRSADFSGVYEGTNFNMRFNISASGSSEGVVLEESVFASVTPFMRYNICPLDISDGVCTIPKEAFLIYSIFTLDVSTDCTFELPSMVNGGGEFYQILIRANVAEGIAINWGTPTFFNGEVPDIGVGKYDFIFEWDGTEWCAGAIEKGVVSS